MNILFWKKKKTSELRVLIVPEDKIESLLILWDAYCNCNRGCRSERYHLWKYIEELFPETRVKGWSIIFTHPTSVSIVEDYREEQEIG